MKIKQKKFNIRQQKRINKRFRHQKLIATLINKIGGVLTLAWFQFQAKTTQKVLNGQKKSKKIKKMVMGKNVIEAKVEKEKNESKN